MTTYLPHLLVDNYANCTLCNIEHSASFTMVELVWHSLLKGTITLHRDVKNVCNNWPQRRKGSLIKKYQW